MSIFVTDKRIETLTYDLICTRKDLKEMTLLVQTNSTTIAELLGLIRDQNKSLTELRLEVESLKTELSVLKKGNSVIEKVAQSEVSVECKTTVEEEIKPEDKPFRHFEFDKSWEELPAVKKWGDLKIVCHIRPSSWLYIQQISPSNPKSIKEIINEIENYYNTKADVVKLHRYLQSLKESYKNVPPGCYIPKFPSLETLLEKKTVLGYISNLNKRLSCIDLDESTLTLTIG